MKILILGANGMLGHVLFKQFWSCSNFEVYGSLRSPKNLKYFNKQMHPNIVHNIDVTKDLDIIQVLGKIRPNVVINCVGIIKQSEAVDNQLEVLTLNSLLPHRLASACRLSDSRLIHISTDCVFNGLKGNYTEDDFSNAEDLYGKSKYLGEVKGLETITLRTSIIGHELESSLSLIDWFLTQKESVDGYSKAFFSGLTTLAIARVIKDYVIPNKSLTGLWHLSANKISKYDLLNLINKIYSKKLIINKNSDFVIDRSLNSDRFRIETGWKPLSWEDMILEMYNHHKEEYNV